jgi:hypothetical protein
MAEIFIKIKIQKEKMN